MEGTRNHDFALKLTEFLIHVLTAQDISLIPDVPKDQAKKLIASVKP